MLLDWDRAAHLCCEIVFFVAQNFCLCRLRSIHRLHVQRVLVGYTWYSFFGKTLKLALYEEKLVNLLVYWQNIEEVGTARRKGREFPSTIDGQKWAAMYVTIHTGMW